MPYPTNLEFSRANQLPTQLDPKAIYIGFAGVPSANAFSFKMHGGKFDCTTRTLLAERASLTIAPADARIVLHQVGALVTLDVATAAYALTRGPHELQSRDWRELVDYVGDVERGVSRAPFESSLYAYFYATGSDAIARFPPPARRDFPDGKEHDQAYHEACLPSDAQRNTVLLNAYWDALDSAFPAGVFSRPGGANRFLEYVPAEVPTQDQRGQIQNEQARYFKHDYTRSETLELELPLKQRHGHTRFTRVSLIAVPSPTARLLKFFTRNATEYPDGQHRSFGCQYTHHPENKGNASEHVISVPPDADFHLGNLSDLLDAVEDDARNRMNARVRPRDSPRPGFAHNNPWYDNRKTGADGSVPDFRTIVDNPGKPTDGSGGIGGTLLGHRDVMEALWYHACPLRTVHPKQLLSSLFIPLRFDGDLGSRLAMGWRACGMEGSSAGSDFFDYIREIFAGPTSKRTGLNASLDSFELPGAVSVVVDPEPEDDEGLTVAFVRARTLARTQEILATCHTDLYCHVYEYGVALLELRFSGGRLADHAEPVSFYDTQWMEQHVISTPARTLLRDVIESNPRAMAPLVSLLDPKSRGGGLLHAHKHFVCTTLSDFDYTGDRIRDGRSVAGGIEMMVSDVDPLYRNLPHATFVHSDRSVTDAISKRSFHASSTSLLNFDDVADEREHVRAHEAARIVFNMVLAQRFLLSEARLDILEVEGGYNERKSMSFARWFARKSDTGRVENSTSNVRELRERIQHMTTRSWFNVVSGNRAIQSTFEKLRDQMYVPKLYEEVTDRTVDLDELINHRQAEAQNRVFNILTFVMSPLGLVTGFTAGYQFNAFKNPFPFGLGENMDGWLVALVYSALFGVAFGLLWLYYRWRSMEG